VFCRNNSSRHLFRPSELAERLAKSELDNLAAYTIGDRPGRVEPRAVKRRPKPHKLLLKPRDQARAELLEAVAP